VLLCQVILKEKALIVRDIQCLKSYGSVVENGLLKKPSRSFILARTAATASRVSFAVKCVALVLDLNNTHIIPWSRLKTLVRRGSVKNSGLVVGGYRKLSALCFALGTQKVCPGSTGLASGNDIVGWSAWSVRVRL
jgi:hypothetical protein